MNRGILRKIFSGLTAVLLLVNSILPYGVASVVYAQEVNDSSAQEVTLSTVIESSSPTISPTPDSTPSLPEYSTPIPDPEVTLTPIPEATPTPTPEIIPSNLSPPTPTPSIESSSTPESASDIDTKATNIETLPVRSKMDLPKVSQIHEQNYVPGDVIVKFRREKLNVNSTFGRLQSFIFERKFSLQKKDELKTSNIQVFKSNKSTDDLVKELELDPSVEYAEPNYLRYPTTISTNDTYKDLLWGMDNIGQTVNGVVGTSDADIDAPEAWNISSGSGNVIVAVIDSGVAYNHPDLVANMWDGSSCKDENGAYLGGCNHGYDFENNDKTPLPDNSSHGTHIAGIIAAAKNNAKGVIGISPNTKIMALKYGLTVANEIRAIDFAIQNGAKVINASFGDSAYSQSEYDAINRFRTAGGIFIAAAGNGGSDGVGDNNENTHYYPTDYNLDNIISVAATDQNDALTSFSNYGTTSVDVGASGVNIYSTIADSTLSNETFENITPPNTPSGWIKGGINNNWGTYSWGGLWGNVLYGDLAYPYANNSETTITSTTYNLSTGGASMSFWAACDTEYINNGWADYMQLEYSSDGAVFTPAIDPFYPGENFRWDEPTFDILNGDPSDPSNPDNTAGGAAFYYEDVLIPSQYLTNNFKFRFRWVSNSSDNNYDGCIVDDVQIDKYSNGSDEKYGYMDGTSMAAPHVAGLAALIWGYKSNLTASQVKDRILQTGDAKPSLAGKTVSGKRINAFNALNGLNHAPTTNPVVTSTNEDGAVTVTFSGSDTDGEALTYSIVSSPTHGTLGVISGNQIIYTPTSNYNGPDSFTYKANDGYADSNTSTVSVTVTPINDAPIANSGSTTTLEDTLKNITLSASDIDGNPLTYSIVSGVSHGVLGTITGNQVNYTPSANYNGSDSFTFKANDGTMDSNTATVNITVTSVNDAPVLDPIGNKTVNELSNLTFTATSTDPDSSVTYSLTGPTGASIVSSTGVFSFTPTEAQGPGSYTVTINVTDGTSTDSETITVTVNEVNVAPVSQAVSTSTNEDTVKTITLVATDSDLPANTLTYSIVSGVSHGVLGVISGNQLTYTPSNNYNGLDAFSYKANDGTIDSNVSVVSITVNSINDAPLSSNGSATINEDTLVTLTLNASDVDGNPLTYSIVSGVSHGVLGTISGNQLSYTPASNYNGSDSFTFKANDGAGDSNVATFSITVTPVNDAPVAIANSYTVNEDTTLNVVVPGVLTNDSDIENQTLSAILVSGVSHGNLTLNTNGSFSYTPGTNYNGPDSFTYKANDGVANSNTVTVSITVNPINDAPVANSDTTSVNEDATLTIAKSALLSNDTDAEADSLTLTAVSNPVHGIVSINGNNVIFIPTTNYSGSASFDYTVSDGQLTSTTTVSVTVNPVNDAPVLNVIGNKNIDEFETLNFTVSASDIDIQNLQFTTSSLPANATFDSVNKIFTFTPIESQGGQNYQITFTVSDGTLSDEETITISVNEVNSAPVAIDDSSSVNEDGVATINTSTLLANDYDRDTDTNTGLTVTSVNTPVNGIVNLVGSTITFTPNANFNGTASFNYVVSDGSLTDVGTVSITVNPINDAPVLNVIGNKNIDEFSTLTINVNAIDVDNANLTYLTGALPQNAAFNSGTKTFTFTPNESQGGNVYNVTFTVSDGSLTDEETISIAVIEVNNAPVAQNDLVSTNEDSAITINATDLLANDSDPDNANNELTLISVSNPTHGTVLISSNNVIFTPSSNYYGPASFDYSVSDGYLSGTASVSVTVNPVNDAPVANAGSVTTLEDTLIQIDLSGSDIDGNSLTYLIVSGVSHGTLGAISGNRVSYTPNINYNGPDSFTFKVNDGVVDSNSATVSITVTPVNDPPILANIGNKTVDELTNLTFIVTATDPDSSVTYSLTGAPTGAIIGSVNGVFSFTPTETQGPGAYTVTVNATDGISTYSEEITITVNEVNVAPVANNVYVTTAEDIAKTINLNATDSDIPANTLTYAIVSGVGNGVLSTVSGNQLTYTPNANYNGEDSFIYKVNDGTADSNPATVTITINPVNDAPVANSDASSGDEDISLAIAKSALLGNDTDVDNDSISLASVSNPVHGSVAIQGDNVVFTPTVNYYGPASFDYVITDGYLTATATVTITINPVNDAPVANDSVVITSQDTSVTINLSSNDVDGDALIYLIETGVSSGVLSEVSGNQVTYTPNLNYVGSDSFTFKTNDTSLDSNIATVNITVNPPPVISNEDSNTPSETSVTITWTTDHPSTSRVVYDIVSHTLLDVAPDYGYSFSSVETDSSTKVTLHSVTINNLTAGTTYYYRVISHGSPEVIGEEKTFTTKAHTDNGGDVAGTSSSSSTSSVCTNQKPGSAPTLISIISYGPNEVTLTWLKAKDPVTYYLLAYGTKPGEMAYGNPSVGGKDTTSYTVRGLSSGTRYFFRVRAGNDCIPGDFSNELSINVYGQILNEISEGFSAGVLGTETTEGVLGKETTSTTPEISSVPEGGPSRRNIIFAGIGVIILTAGYYFIVRRRRE